jgi:hypothetical protein
MKQNVPMVFIKFSLGSILRGAAACSQGIRMSGGKSPMDGAGRENAAHRLNPPLIGRSLSSIRTARILIANACVEQSRSSSC